MRLYKKIIIALMISFTVSTLSLSRLVFAQVSTFRVGTAQIDITPPPGLNLAGYAARKSGAIGVLDPLYAKIVVMSGKGEKVALVNLDLANIFDEPQLEQIRKDALTTCGIDQVIFCSTHTHSGPNFGGSISDVQTVAWVTRTIQSVLDCIKLANIRLEDAYIGVGFGKAYIGHNRRRGKPEGNVRFLSDNLSLILSYPEDPTVAVIRIDNSQGLPRAILVNYACHPVVFSPDNMKYSADYPGAMAQWIKEHVPGNPTCFFIQGACGNINPITNPVSITQNAVKVKNELGYALGKEVVRVNSLILTHPVPDARLKTVLKKIPFKQRWNVDQLRETTRNLYGAAFADWAERWMKETLDSPLTVLVLENEFGICGFPGEFYVDFQLDLRKRFTDLPLFFAGYMNGDNGYYPTLKAAVEGGYGANSITTLVEVGAGEQMIDQAIIELYYLTGKLSH